MPATECCIANADWSPRDTADDKVSSESMKAVQSTLFDSEMGWQRRKPISLENELERFHSFGTETRIVKTIVERESTARVAIPTYINEFWTSAQRVANSIHEISYRACFKPQLPRFFIDRLTERNDVVYDPFMGRGTTLIEAALMGRIPEGCDVNPLSRILLKPRLNPPSQTEVESRLGCIDLSRPSDTRQDLLVFYHKDTLSQLCALREYLLARESDGERDKVDEWIQMVAVNRLTGHSPGFFSVYTLPPNQAVSIDAQRKINQSRGQSPPKRDVVSIIARKSRSLLSDCGEAVRRSLSASSAGAILLTHPANETPEIPSSSVSLVVTSPPFLDTVDYAADNWLRCWFCGINPSTVPLTVPRKLSEWQASMTSVFVELKRVLRPGGSVAFEVGEVRGGRIKLEETVVQCGADVGLDTRLVLINDQEFTKTSNLWGVTNRQKGTNTNRIVLFKKSAA